MTEAPKELWVVCGPKGRQALVDEFENIAVGRAVVNYHQLEQFNEQIIGYHWADMQAEGWQCVKYVREK